MYDNNNISELGWHDYERSIAVEDDQAGVWWDLMGGWWNLPLHGRAPAVAKNCSGQFCYRLLAIKNSKRSTLESW